MARRRRRSAAAQPLHRARRRSRPPPAQCPEISLLFLSLGDHFFLGPVDLNFVARAAGKPHAQHTALMPPRTARGTAFC